MDTTTVAVDLAKSAFELAVSDGLGRVTERKRLSREGFRKFFVNREPCRIVMEACGTAHHWARTFAALGHEVKLLPPQHVRRNKTDRADAVAILLEADRCGDILPVSVKTEAHAPCARRLDGGTHGADQRGARAAAGVRLRPAARPGGGDEAGAGWLIDESLPIPPALRQALSAVMDGIRALETRITEVGKQLRQEARQRPTVQKRMAVPGIGLLTATALAAWLGIPPKGVQQRPQAQARQDRQAWRPIPAHPADPRREVGAQRRLGKAAQGR